MVIIDIPHSNNIPLIDMTMRVSSLMLRTYQYPFLLSASFLSWSLVQFSLFFPTVHVSPNKPEWILTTRVSANSIWLPIWMNEFSYEKHDFAGTQWCSKSKYVKILCILQTYISHHSFFLKISSNSVVSGVRITLLVWCLNSCWKGTYSQYLWLHVSQYNLSRTFLAFVLACK